MLNAATMIAMVLAQTRPKNNPTPAHNATRPIRTCPQPQAVGVNSKSHLLVTT